jgi:hypothetical protein
MARLGLIRGCCVNKNGNDDPSGIRKRRDAQDLGD